MLVCSWVQKKYVFVRKSWIFLVFFCNSAVTTTLKLLKHSYFLKWKLSSYKIYWKSVHRRKLEEKKLRPSDERSLQQNFQKFWPILEFLLSNYFENIGFCILGSFCDIFWFYTAEWALSVTCRSPIHGLLETQFSGWAPKTSGFIFSSRGPSSINLFRFHSRQCYNKIWDNKLTVNWLILLSKILLNHCLKNKFERRQMKINLVIFNIWTGKGV